MFSEKDKRVLRKHYGEYAPANSDSATSVLNNSENPHSDPIPPAVYLALQNLRCLDMGKKTSPKKKARQRGQRIRKKRTGSRKG